MALLYADEDFPFPVVEQRRRLGHDVPTTLEAGRLNRGILDEDQLAFATSLGRAILTRNRRHFIPLHRKSTQHAGIISVTDDTGFAGQAQRINVALAGITTPAGHHVRVNRPNRPPSPTDARDDP
jgi:hypothetical protein